MWNSLSSGSSPVTPKKGPHVTSDIAGGGRPYTDFRDAQDNAPRDVKGQTPLMLAEKGGRLEDMLSLLRRGADVNALDKSGKTALRRAAGHGRVQFVAALCDAGAKVDSRDKLGRTPLMKAAAKGHTDVLKELLKRKANFRLADEWAGSALVGGVSQGKTALHHAARKGNVECIEALIAAGAEVDPKDSDGRTPLILAADAGHLDALKALLKAKSDVSVKDKAGLTALHASAAVGSKDAVVLLAQAKAEIDARANDSGQTPLMKAAQCGAIEALTALLQHKASVMLTDKQGRTALHYAASKGSPGCVAVLATAGALLDVRDSSGNTPLMDAAICNNVEAATELLRSGARVEANSDEGRRLAVEAKVDVLLFLIENFHDLRFLSVPRAVGLIFSDSALSPAEVTKVRLASIATALELEDLKKVCPGNMFTCVDLFLLSATTLPSQAGCEVLLAFLHALQPPSKQLFAAGELLESLSELLENKLAPKERIEALTEGVTEMVLAQLSANQELAKGTKALAFEHDGNSFLRMSVSSGVGAIVRHPLVEKHLKQVWRGTNTLDLESWFTFSFVVPLGLACLFPSKLFSSSEYRKPRDFWECDRKSWRSANPLNSPKSRWIFESIILIVFVVLGAMFSYQLGEVRGVWSTLVEWSFWVLVLSFLVQEGQQVLDVGWEHYAKEVWNVIDMSMLVGFSLSFLLKVTAEYLHWHWVPWQKVFAISSLLSWLRVLEIFLISPRLGPLIVSLFDMVSDMALFATIFTVVLCGFVQAFLVMGPPGASAVDLLWGLFVSFLGRDSPGLSFEDVGMGAMGPILLSTFLVVTTVLLLNLLIAQLSFTFSRIARKRDEEFALQRAEIILDRLPGSLTCPAPFNLIEVALYPILGSFKVINHVDVTTFLMALIFFPLTDGATCLVLLFKFLARLLGYVFFCGGLFSTVAGWFRLKTFDQDDGQSEAASVDGSHPSDNRWPDKDEFVAVAEGFVPEDRPSSPRKGPHSPAAIGRRPTSPGIGGQQDQEILLSRMDQIGQSVLRQVDRRLKHSEDQMTAEVQRMGEQLAELQGRFERKKRGFFSKSSYGSAPREGGNSPRGTASSPRGNASSSRRNG